MNIFEDRGGGKLHWKLNLYVLWVCVFFCCASYTMCIPFLPVYLLQHLGVAQSDVNEWTGLIYSVTFFTAAVMAPYWGAHADRIGQRLMAIRAGFGLAIAGNQLCADGHVPDAGTAFWRASFGRPCQRFCTGCAVARFIHAAGS